MPLDHKQASEPRDSLRLPGLFMIESFWTWIAARHLGHVTFSHGTKPQNITNEGALNNARQSAAPPLPVVTRLQRILIQFLSGAGGHIHLGFVASTESLAAGQRGTCRAVLCAIAPGSNRLGGIKQYATPCGRAGK